MSVPINQVVKLGVVDVEIRLIKGNPYQTRLHIEAEPLKVLTRSIRERGLFSPITILEDGKGGFIVIHGHRRLAACRRLRWKTIPAFVKKRSQQNDLITDLIHENLVREDLSVQEKALTIRLLFSKIESVKNDVDAIISVITAGKLFKTRHPSGEGYNPRNAKFTGSDVFYGMKLLKSIGMSENNAIAYLTVLKLPEKIQARVSFNVHNDQGQDVGSHGRISIKMASALARVDDAAYRDWLFKRAMEGCSARHVDALVNNYKSKVLQGEWKGFVKQFHNSSQLTKYDENLLMELSAKCENLRKSLSTFRATHLDCLDEVMEKEVFTASAADLRVELRNLDETLKQRLKARGYSCVENRKGNEAFEMSAKEMEGKGYVRGTIPRKILQELGYGPGSLVAGDTFQVKIVGIKKALTRRGRTSARRSRSCGA
ncbi:MAG: ParB/RepB/Spo0J family partition protein [Candidatus Micrarchaeia archaeon]